ADDHHRAEERGADRHLHARDRGSRRGDRRDPVGQGAADREPEPGRIGGVLRRDARDRGLRALPVPGRHVGVRRRRVARDGARRRDLRAPPAPDRRQPHDPALRRVRGLDRRVGVRASAVATPAYFFFRREPLDFFFAGTLPPARRAFERPIAIACLRLFTFFFDFPDLSFPRFFSCIAFFTSDFAFLP